MQDTFKCTQCSEVFISKSAQKSHVRNYHQIIVKLTDSHGNIIQIEKINNVFSCPASTCQYSTDNAALMQSHYSRCRFRIRKSIPQVPHNPNNVFIPNRVPPAGDEIEENPALKTWGILVQKWANVLICTNENGHVGLLPHELLAHLKNQHQINLSSSMVNSFLDPLGSQPNNIYQLGHPISPFQGIRIYLGLVCKTCSYACVKRETMGKHFVNKHWAPDTRIQCLIVAGRAVTRSDMCNSQSPWLELGCGANGDEESIGERMEIQG
ncbi:hypothetical protein VP01_518g1 [Puccinia sorghi]|uniref:C2H2-type domain-containing protein n=1 Tax=Puccinia sorghi TaxID=27349 RepID=A0A0L6UKS2_9BASI|nr:hypothetical protein VP01_518g1 [Puccinia sorghi]